MTAPQQQQDAPRTRRGGTSPPRPAPAEPQHEGRPRSASVQGAVPEPAASRPRSNAVTAPPATVGAGSAAAPGAGSAVPHPAAPTISAIAVPGVDAALETTNPRKAIEGYHSFAGTLLQKAQRYDQEIETNARLVETEHRRIATLHEQYLNLPNTPQGAKRRAEMEDKLGAKRLKKDVPRAAVWDIALDVLEERSRLAAAARRDADEDIPLIDGVYQQTRDAKKGVTKPAVTADAMAITARSLGLAVREAKLSEGRLYVKVKELEAHKEAITGATLSLKWIKTNARPAGLAKKAASGLVGVATAGIVGLEDTGPDGGGRFGVKTVWLWDRIQGELAKIDQLQQKKPYGRATTLHISLQLFNVMLRELRGLASGLATLVGALGVAVVLVAPPLGAVLKTLAVALGLIALGLTAVKIVIDAILASWSGLRRLSTTNARNKNLLQAQARSQGVELLGDSASMAVAIGTPALANAGQLGVHGTSHYLNPLHQAQTLTSSVARHGGSRLAELGQVAATKGVSLANTGATKAAQYFGPDKMADETAKHRKTPAPRPPVARPRPAAPPGPPGPAIKPAEEPAWLTQARASGEATLAASMAQLVRAHAAKLQMFHDKTQALMRPLIAVHGDAAKAEAQLAAAKRPDTDGAVGNSGQMSTSLRRTARELAEGASELKEAQLAEELDAAAG